MSDDLVWTDELKRFMQHLKNAIASSPRFCQKDLIKIRETIINEATTFDWSELDEGMFHTVYKKRSITAKTTNFYGNFKVTILTPQDSVDAQFHGLYSLEDVEHRCRKYIDAVC